MKAEKSTDSSLAIVILGFVLVVSAIVMFTQQQYFSLLAMILTIIVYALGFTLIMLPEIIAQPNGGIRKIRLVAVLFFALIITIFEGIFDLSGKVGFTVSVAANYAMPILLASVIAAVAVALISKKVKRDRPAIFYILAAVAFIMLFLFLYLIARTYWGISDSLLIIFEGTKLFLHGANPYVQNYGSYLASHAIPPTYYINGTCECSYIYPALSFLAFLPIAFANVKTPEILISISVFLEICVGFLVYSRMSKRSFISVLALFLWFTIALYGATNGVLEILAIPLLALLAFLYRDRAYVSGLLLGIAASLQQLAWVIIPFMLVFMYSERGGKHAIKIAVFAALVFILLNSYFIYSKPSIILDNFLIPEGSLEYGSLTITQLFLGFYNSIRISYTIVEISVFAALLALLYTYPRRLINLTMCAPVLCMLASPRNGIEYVAPFLPLMVVIVIDRPKKMIRNDANSAMPAVLIMLALFLTCAASVIYGHLAYQKSNTLSITDVSGTMMGNGYVFSVVVHNSGTVPTKVALYYTSRNPNFHVKLITPYFYMDNPVPSTVIGPGSNATLFGQLPYQVSNTTLLYLQASSSKYDVTKIMSVNSIK